MGYEDLEYLAAWALCILICILLYISSDVLRALGAEPASSRHLGLSLFFGLLSIALLAYSNLS